MTKLLKALASLVLLAMPCQALITVNEGLATTLDGIKVSTNPPQLLVNQSSYTGKIPTASIAVASNAVFGADKCVIYSSGSLSCSGPITSGSGSGSFVPYTGATGDVTLGTHNMLAAQFGAGTSPSTNFLFDGLGTGSAYVRIGAGTNLATGYYWGGTRGYSLQERYDLTGTPFTLHDELNNVDRFYLDTSGGWYFVSASVTASSFTALGASGFKGNGGSLTGIPESGVTNLTTDLANKMNLGGSTVTADASLYGTGIDSSKLGVQSSSVAVLNSSGKVQNFQVDSSSVVKFGANTLIQNYQIDPSSVNKVIGISSGPAGSGQFLENATIQDGVVTGGDFASASGSGAGLSSTNTFTAPNTFTSTVTVGITAMTSTITVSGYMADSWQVVMSTKTSANSRVDLTGLSGGKRYRIDYDVNCSVAGSYIYFRLNNDSTAGNYNFAAQGENSGPAGIGWGTGSISLAGCGVTYTANDGNAFNNAQPISGSMEFSDIAVSGIVGMNFFSGWRNTGGPNNTVTGKGSCFYTNGSPSEISFIVSGGTCTGKLVMLQRNEP